MILIVLCLAKQENIPKEGFVSPFVPILPALGILGNFFLCAQVTQTTWIYFAAYETLGLLFYIFYGYVHSNLR